MNPSRLVVMFVLAILATMLGMWGLHGPSAIVAGSVVVLFLIEWDEAESA